MSHATSSVPAGVVLDWTRGRISPQPEPCVFGDGPALCRSPVRNAPCHKRCAEAWITAHARDADHLAALIRDHTPRGGAR